MATFNINISCQYFISTFPFHTTWKHQHTRSFLMLIVGIEWEHWPEMTIVKSISFINGYISHMKRIKNILISWDLIIPILILNLTIHCTKVYISLTISCLELTYCRFDPLKYLHKKKNCLRTKTLSLRTTTSSHENKNAWCLLGV